MSISSTDLTKVTIQQDLIEVNGNGNALQPFLRIHPPDKASTTPPILAFTRKREVEIPWGEIVRDEAGDETVISAGTEAIKAIREYFEESWPFEVNKAWLNDDANHLLVEPNPETSDWGIQQCVPGAWPHRPNFDILEEDGSPKIEALTEGFIIHHVTSGRVYHLIDPDKKLTAEHFESWEMYEEAWEKCIDGVELVFNIPDEAKTCYMDFEEVDLRPVVIQRKYEELRILRDFATTVKVKVAGVTDNMIERIVETSLDVDELEQLQRKVLQLEINEYDVQSRIERLASDAARLGYLLVIEEGGRTIEFKDRDPKILKSGKLYTTYKRTARWTEYESKKVSVRVGWWIFSIRKIKEVKIPLPKEEVVVDYQMVDTSKDVFEEKRTAMVEADLQVYVFEQTPSGLVSTDGEPLHLIMDRCKYDEYFRQHCAVMLPVYEESLTGQRMVAKYAIYKRPLPGMVATILPRLSLDESLTYRTAWTQTQLGELLNSINLAPDEERKVTITKRFEQETSVSRTSTSIFDISRAESTDLATEMENQTRQEQESSKHLEFSTKASGGWGAFSAEASASGGTSTSLKDMSQAISKVANKAAKSVNSQNREEVSSTSTARTTIANTDETVATIHNINQGRSLNLMFYRLYNKYEGGLYLEGLRFEVIKSVEVIAGSGVHESKSYSLEELPGMINEFKAAQLPFAIKDEEVYTNRLLESIETLLLREYATDNEDEVRTLATPEAATMSTSAKSSMEATSVSVARLSFPHPEVYREVAQVNRIEAASTASMKLSEKAPQLKKADRVDADSKLLELTEMLRRTVIYSDEPIAPQELLVAAPGLYLDAVVGAQPSTEPYSENMREQEVQMRAAEVSVKQAESAYQRALALQLTQMIPNDDCNCLTGLLPGVGQRSLTLSLLKPLDPGDWRLQVDGQEKGKVESTDVYRHIVAFSWSSTQPWLKTDGLHSKLRLMEKSSGNMITFKEFEKIRS